VFKASVIVVSDRMCWNCDMWSTKLLGYFIGGLVGVP